MVRIAFSGSHCVGKTTLVELVHEKLHHLLVDDALGFGAEVLDVQGDLPARVDQILDRIGREKRRSVVIP